MITIADKIVFEIGVAENAIRGLPTEHRNFNPDTKDPYNQTKVIPTEFVGKDDWPDDIIFRKDGAIIFATRQLFKGKKSNLFAANRLDGPAICRDHALHWCINGQFHRIGAPASMWQKGDSSGSEWCVNGKWHREDGPAISVFNCKVGSCKMLWLENHRLIKKEEYVI